MSSGASSPVDLATSQPQPLSAESLNLAGERPPMPTGLAPPTYQQAIQLEPLPSDNAQSIPDEPPPEYSGPSPEYKETQPGDGRFHGESTMSVAEEQERMNQVENEIGRLLVL